MALADDLKSFKSNYLDRLNIVGHPLIEDDPLSTADDEKLSDSEEYAMLKAAAEDFARNYQQDRMIADVARENDRVAMARLRAAEEGKTPSAAEALMRTAIDRNIDQATGVAARVAPGMALRAGLDAQQRGGAAIAAGTGNARAAEIAAARQLLADSISRAHAIETSGAVGTGNTLAGAVVAPYKAKMRERAAKDARQAAYMQTGAGLLGGVASDIRLKRDIRPAPQMADDFLRSLSARIGVR